MSLPGGGEVEDLFVSAYKYYFLYSMYSMYARIHIHNSTGFIHTGAKYPSQNLAWRITRALINQGPSPRCRRIPNFCLLIRCPRRQIARSEPFSRFAWLLALHPPSLRDRLGGPLLDNSSGSGFELSWWEY